MISAAADSVLSLRIPTPHRKKAAAIASPTSFGQPVETQRLAHREGLMAHHRREYPLAPDHKQFSNEKAYSPPGRKRADEVVQLVYRWGLRRKTGRQPRRSWTVSTHPDDE